MRFAPSAWLLLISNVFPAVMVLKGGWELGELLVLYWLESWIIGFFSVFKIILSGKPLPPSKGKELFPGSVPAIVLAGKILLSLFFCFHFGMFMAVHGVFLFGLVLGGFWGRFETSDICFYFYKLLWPLSFLFLSHGFSFFANYLFGGESLKTSPFEAMQGPYPRIVVMHLTILAGAFLTVALKGGSAFLIVFVCLKVLFDLKGHLGERKKYSSIST
ncbi:MAG: hypothetical protein Fur0012_00930 [Elusimicrobiota bacterium]